MKTVSRKWRDNTIAVSERVNGVGGMNWGNFDREDFMREGNGQGNGSSGIRKEK
jgi:hypothetical protein